MASLLERELAGDGHQISRVCRGLRVKANCSVKGQIVISNSELTEADQEEFRQVQELLKNLRRKTVSFVALPRIGGASGAEYSKLPMGKLWETMRLGEKNPRKKVDVRAFVLSADVFPPNVVKHATTTGLSEPIKADAKRMKRVIDFIITKRQKDDVILLFDGRSRTCRKVLEQFEEKLSASTAHSCE